VEVKAQTQSELPPDVLPTNSEPKVQDLAIDNSRGMVDAEVLEPEIVAKSSPGPKVSPTSPNQNNKEKVQLEATPAAVTFDDNEDWGGW